MARILILGAKVPFSRGGQDALVASLMHELRKREHEVDLLELPFEPFPKEGLLVQAAWWRSLQLEKVAGRAVDLLIATKFPTYYARHPRKSVWLVHQRREIFELLGTRYSDFSDDPRDELQRRLLTEGDGKVLGEAAYLSGISGNVIERLWDYSRLRGEVLYPPLPLGDRYHTAEAENYVLSVGRLCTIKRVDLMIKALPHVPHEIRLRIAGLPDEPGIMEYFQNEIAKHHLWERVEFLGRVSDEELLRIYAKALCVYFAPHDEDYGYITLEAFASGKPVIAATDSGGVLEFVRHEKTGLVCEPNSPAFAAAVTRLHEDRALARQLGVAGRLLVEEAGLNNPAAWDRIIARLLSPLSGQTGMATEVVPNAAPHAGELALQSAAGDGVTDAGEVDLNGAEGRDNVASNGPTTLATLDGGA